MSAQPMAAFGSDIRLSEAVLRLWFGSPSASSEAELAQRIPFWFGKRPEDDATVVRELGPLWELACAGKLIDWAETAHGLLALLVLRDQVPRVIWRGSARAFSFDDANLELAREGCARGFDRELSPVEAVFFYMPFMHSEQLALQEQSLSLYHALARRAPASVVGFTNKVLSIAARHHEIVQRFGRYPHRNLCLGRESTVSELDFLQQPNSSF